MGEAVTSSEEGMEMEVEGTRKKGNSSSDVAKFLPRMVLRVLLVEADDSTRQIITALLRKCSYRVAAVPDGLKAWETLKGRPHNIDLILTEVELPSISGYALLTLIMEHDICKKIPVIMMSSQDSISLVFKCMLKGAADFLIKPVRRNELRNLWQHVWRRQIQTIGHIPEKAVGEQPKVEVTSENNSASNHSSDCLDYTPTDKECTEKGSDAQSSCTTPYLEAESGCMQDMRGISQLKQGDFPNLSNTEKHEECVELIEKPIMPNSEIGGKLIGTESATLSCNEACKSTASTFGGDHVGDKIMAWDLDLKARSHGEHTNDNIKDLRLAHDLGEPSHGVLDLIGKFESHLKDSCRNLNVDNGANKFCSTPELELSLRRLRPSYPNNEVTDERHILNHSNASAFSRYNNGRASGLAFPTLTSNSTQLKDGATTLQNDLFNDPSRNAVYTQTDGAAAKSLENVTTLFTGQRGSSEVALPGSQLGFIPVSRLKPDSFFTGCSQILPPVFYMQSGFPPAWSPKCQQLSPSLVSSTLHPSSEIHHSEQGHSQYEETANYSGGLTVQEEDNNLEAEEITRDGSPTPELSAVGSLCDGTANKLNSSASQTTCNGSDADATPNATTTGPSASESVNDNHFFVRNGLRGTDSCYSSQREAALLKFRMKRKDRCYEKRVRYQSRKRLAEQRPRVKGQFVRQAEAGPPQTES